jgi:glycosyltransferase involved in cell wall biosynthesis
MGHLGLSPGAEDYRPQDIARLARRGLASPERPRECVIVGSPPEDEIGFGLAVGAVGVLRPRSVVILDASARRATRISTTRLLATRGPGMLVQAAVGATSMMLQRALALALTRARSVDRRGTSADLQRVTYLYPIPGRRSSAGGAATHAHEVIRAFRRRRVSVAPFTTNEAFTDGSSGERDIGWIGVASGTAGRVVPAAAAFAGDIALLRKAYRHVRSADLIYQRHQRFALVGAGLAMLTNKPLFLEYNGRGDFMVSDPRLFAAQRRLCERAALHAAARVVVVSEVERQRLAREGLDRQRILVCPNGVDARRFANGGGERVRESLGVDPSNQVIGFVGTFGPWHGAPVLAEAFARLAAHAPEARLLLVGDGLERPAAEAILAAHRADERVILVGKVPGGEVPSYLDACDILASPHVPLPAGEEFFGSPTKLFEYMAAAKPIVASRLGQIGDVLVDGETALLVAPGSVEELARGIMRLLGDASLRERLGRAAREAAIARHSWDRNVAEIAHAYSQLMPTRAKR